MKRELTNKFRFVLDELIPPIIRDSRWFMWPLFVVAYGKISVSKLMDFKSKAYSMNDSEYAQFYGSLGNSMSKRRGTDLNEKSISYLTENFPKEDGLSIIDVGAGNGYLLDHISRNGNWAKIVGVDVAPSEKGQSKFEIHAGALPSLPFRDNEFDVVTCTHVLEHVLDPAASVKDLIRVARKKLFVVVPKQRWYYYTLDEHLNFYPTAEPLKYLFEPYDAVVTFHDGDWVVMVDLEAPVLE